MRFIFVTFSFYALFASSNTAHGQAGASFDQSSAVASTTEIPQPSTAGAKVGAPGAPALFRGTVKCPEGLLPGAVVHVNGTRTYVVTNATGDFELTVPDSTTSIEVTCSFAGFRDVVQHLRVKAPPATIVLDKLTELPPPDRSAETGWW